MTDDWGDSLEGMRDQKRQVPVKDIVNDILDGLTDLELMTKYKILWATDLYRVFNRLIMMGIVEKDEIKYRLPEGWKVKWSKEDPAEKLEPEGKSNHLNARQAPRNRFFGCVEICDMTTHARSYGLEIKDISEFGLMVAPIKIVKNELREFLIKPTHLEDVHAISFVAECRWTDGIRAGFKITSISPTNMRELQKLIKLFSFEA
jgi:hypothetical protein